MSERASQRPWEKGSFKTPSPPLTVNETHIPATPIANPSRNPCLKRKISHMENFFRELFQQRAQAQAPPGAAGGDDNNSGANNNGAIAPDVNVTANADAEPNAVPVFVFMSPDYIMATIFGGPMGGMPAMPAGIPVPPNFMNAAMAASMMQEQPTGSPPTSARALQQLPIISVTSHDLIEPVNRECCICLAENELHSKVLRLPCAHILHPDCAKQWLTKHNTCPVCRYELPTDCPQYEQGRLERMRSRKPRFARHELDRLSIRELKELLKREDVASDVSKYHPVDKNDLIQYLIQSNVIDLIPSPPPVEYCYTELKQMSISRLKEVMNDAGVFFSKEDVVEKDDLLRLFLMSGRLTVLSEEETLQKQTSPDGKPTDATKLREHRSPPLVETVFDDSDEENCDNMDERADADLLMEENDSFEPAAAPDGMMAETGQYEDADEIQVVHLGANDADMDDIMDVDEEEIQRVQSSSGDLQISQSVGTETILGVAFDANEPSQGTDQAASRTRVISDASVATTSSSGGEVSEDNVRIEDNGLSQGGNLDGEHVDYDHNANDASLSRKRQRRLDEAAISSLTEEEACDGDGGGMEENQQTVHQNQSVEIQVTEPPYPTMDHSESEIVQRFQALGINQLQVLAREYSVDTTNCLEKGDIIDRLVAFDQSRAVNTTFEDWGCGEMRALASLVDVDLSQTTCRHEMIGTLHDEVSRRPHAGRYLLALAPLARLTTAQLQAVARAWVVNVSDCLERGEIIHRLVFAAQNREYAR
ncbi:hypothetical protein MPSEU_000404300 [Mayamaea pseudoterrestris]|nr:hypothetical protein MPSEU_000404300 [Mayamaea pseudoterrestris]